MDSQLRRSRGNDRYRIHPKALGEILIHDCHCERSAAIQRIDQPGISWIAASLRASQ
jgi:hypothetical protein